MKKSKSKNPQNSSNEFKTLSEKNRYDFKKFKCTFIHLYVSLKFIYLILSVLLFTIILSVFIPQVASNQNIVSIRASFSSIIGYLLESSSSKISASNKFLLYKNASVGILSLVCTLIIILAIFLDINSDNASLILIKNTLLSGISFLISSVKRCVSNNGADGCLSKSENQTLFDNRGEPVNRNKLNDKNEKENKE